MFLRPLSTTSPSPIRTRRTKSRSNFSKLQGRLCPRAEGRGGRRALAYLLLDQGKRGSGAQRFVKLSEARDLAGRAGDLPLALQAIDELAKTYAIDIQAMKITSLKTASADAFDPLPVVDFALDLAVRARNNDQYEDALRFGKLASKPSVSRTTSHFGSKSIRRWRIFTLLTSSLPACSPLSIASRGIRG